MGYRGSRLRRAGLFLLALGLGSAAVLFVAFAWFARENASRFSEFVSWANIVSVPLSMVGIVLTLTDKYVSQANPSAELLAATADDVAREALRQDGFLLADLLSTDVPDARLAGACFQAGKSSPTRKSGKKPPAPDVRRFDEITGYFTQEAGHRLVILGDSGSGKTVLAVTLTVGLLEQRSATPAEERQRTPVPCLLHLPSWNAEAADLGMAASSGREPLPAGPQDRRAASSRGPCPARARRLGRDGPPGRAPSPVRGSGITDQRLHRQDASDARDRRDLPIGRQVLREACAESVRTQDHRPEPLA